VLVLAALMVAAAIPTLAAPPADATPVPSAGKLANPVTAVLLDIRGYDTLLETAVLVEALMGVWILGRTPALAPGHAPAVLAGLARLVIPLMVVVAGAVLWNGAAGTGGAFQAAAILAAAGILARLAGFPLTPLHAPRRRAALAASGTGVFLAVGLAVMAPGRAFLDYPAAWQGGLVLLIEGVATVSLAAVLVVLFEATSPREHAAEDSP
jgi:multisubunit Na+/H+ antiporter MnhB subunit